jgi:hypothetical protein
LEFGIWILEFGSWNLGFGIWALELETRNKKPETTLPTHNTR